MKNNFILLFVCLIIFGCKKNDDTSTINNHIEENRQDFLQIKSAEELNSLVDKVSKLSDADYVTWKKEAGLTRTLYDRFINVEKSILTTGADRVPYEDSSFFFIKNDLLQSKNGLALDKVLNETGIVQVGNIIIRYENNNIYYSKNTSDNRENVKILTSKQASAVTLGNSVSKLTVSTNALPPSDKSLRSGVMAASDHTAAPGSASQQTFNFLVYSTRHQDPGGKRRRWVELSENYILVPVTVSGSNVTWSVSYRFYMQFSQQKKVLFTWNSYPAAAEGAFTFGGNFPDWNYYPGGISQYDAGTLSITEKYYQIQSYGSSYVPYLAPTANLSFKTANATHTEYTIYRSNATQSVPTSGNLGSTLVLNKGKISMTVFSHIWDAPYITEDYYNYSW